MHQVIIDLFAVAAGLAISGIVTNAYRMLASSIEAKQMAYFYYPVMALAGPNVLMGNAKRHLTKDGQAFFGSAIATAVSLFWSFMIGGTIIMAVQAIR